MEQLGSNGLKALLAFTALRLEFGWSTTPITSAKLANLLNSPMRKTPPNTPLDAVQQGLLN